MREAIQRRLQTVEESKADVEAQKETLRAQISGLERGNNAVTVSVSRLFQFVCLNLREK